MSTHNIIIFLSLSRADFSFVMIFLLTQQGNSNFQLATAAISFETSILRSFIGSSAKCFGRVFSTLPDESSHFEQIVHFKLKIILYFIEIAVS